MGDEYDSYSNLYGDDEYESYDLYEDYNQYDDAQNIENQYDTEYDTEYDDELETGDVVDEWFDEYDNAQWIVLDGDSSGDYIENLLHFNMEDESLWNEIDGDIQTIRGRPLTKRCMSIFGRSLCVCEFMDWLRGQEIGGNTKHICYAPKFAINSVTKKTLEKLRKIKMEKEKNIKIKEQKLKMEMKKEKMEMEKEEKHFEEYEKKMMQQMKEQRMERKKEEHMMEIKAKKEMEEEKKVMEREEKAFKKR